MLEELSVYMQTKLKLQFNKTLNDTIDNIHRLYYACMVYDTYSFSKNIDFHIEIYLCCSRALNDTNIKR